MEPIRGPLDYHRYPPKTKNTQHNPTASMSSPDSTPHQPRRRPASSQPTSGAPGERVLRRPHERQADQARRTDRTQQVGIENIVVPAEHAKLDSEAYNDWLEGRHRGPGARRRNRRMARATEAGEPALRHVPHGEAEPGQHPARKKSRHLRSLWERRRKTEKPALKRFHTPFWKVARRVAVCLLVVGTGELIAAALTTPRLAVQGVEITGAQVTPSTSLQPITQQLVGQNWIRVRTRSAALAAAKLPSVKEARVERVLSLPPMKLALRITERQPFARVGGGNTWWVVDREGIPFRRADKRDESLHAVTSPALRPAQIRLGVALTDASWKPFVVLADALEKDMKNGGQWQLRRTYLDKFGFASLRLTGGSNNELLVRLGGGQWPQKLQRARQALDYFAATGRRAAALNLVSYNMPTWTPYKPTEPEENPSESSASEVSASEVSSSEVSSSEASASKTSQAEDAPGTNTTGDADSGT